MKNENAGSTGNAARPAGKFRHTAVVWLVIGGIINYVDRSSLSITAPAMVRDLGLSMTQIGLMGTVFAWCYAVAQIPTGWISDRVNARIVFAVSLLVWSAATMATGFFSALWVILACRAVLGIAEAPCWPTATKIISFWYPREERGVAIGIFTSSAKWGPAIAPPILVWMMIHYGWRGLFVVTGVAGIVFALIFYVFYRNPDKSRLLGSAELDYIKRGGGGHEFTLGSTRSSISWRALFGYRSVWGMILGYFCAIWIWNTFIVFLPLYLLATYHISLAKLGIFASVPWIGGAFGAICSGFVAKWVMRRFKMAPLKANKCLISLYALLAAVALACMPASDTLGLTIVITTIALIFIAAINATAWTMASDIAPPSMVGSVSSIQNFGGYFGGAFAPLVTGMIVDATGSYTLAFLSAAVIAVGAAICYFWIVDKPIEAEEAPEVAHHPLDYQRS